jgi:glyoxylase-like metal-dependent hydrolase (beta-lactamase superfamily II)
MRGWIARIGFALLGCALAPVSAASAQKAAPQVTLTRLDCGTLRANDASSFSDSHGYDGQSILDMPVSCYLIRHGDDYLLWDAGLSASLLGAPLSDKVPIGATVTRTILDQLRALGVDPAKVTRVAISHYHLDHAGQASSFPQATLLIGKADLAALKDGTAALVDRDGLKPWLDGTAKLQEIAADLDVFGDGTVVIMATPGHTDGHKGLLVRLAKMGPVLLTGDLVHSRRNYEVSDVSAGNLSRADTLASIDRFKRNAANLHATVIIGHEAADIAKLPAFPQAAH